MSHADALRAMRSDDPKAWKWNRSCNTRCCNASRRRGGPSLRAAPKPRPVRGAERPTDRLYDELESPS